MRGSTRGGWRLAAAVVAGAVAVGAPAAKAQDKTFTMKLGTATINDPQHEWMKNFVAAVEKDSGGRIKGEIYPASQLGSIPRQIEGTQFGEIQGWIGPPEFLVGVDQRFEVLSAPGMFTGFEQAERVISDPEIKTMMLGIGDAKGLKGVGLFISGPSAVNTKKPIHHLADFKGMKIRVLASPFQNELITRMGGTPVALTLSDVLPAIQQGAIDGALSTFAVFTPMQYFDAAKEITETGQPFVFSVAEISSKWFATLPADLQKIVVDQGAAVSKAIAPWDVDFMTSQRKVWVDKGGDLTRLPADEQAAMMESISSVGEDMSKSKPALHAAFETLVGAVKRDK